jgi:hypothetical protein
VQRGQEELLWRWRVVQRRLDLERSKADEPAEFLMAREDTLTDSAIERPPSSRVEL